MIILHIAYIGNDLFSGVSVVVPEHVAAQGQYANCALCNLKKIRIDSKIKQLEYTGNFELKKLEPPFNNPDLVVFHETYIKEYLKIYKQLKKNNIAYIIVPHSQLTVEALEHKKWKKHLANVLFFKKFFNGAAAIQCLSSYELDRTKNVKYAFVGTNGIKIPNIKKSAFSEKPTRFLYIGRLEAYQKGLDLLIKAVSQIKNQLIEAGFILEIYGPDYNGRYAYLEELISTYNVGKIVELNHEISGIEKENKLIQADFFIQTSRFEGMPMGILEALGYGIPCLVTEGTTLGEKINEYGAGYVCRTDETAIAQCILKSMNSSKCESIEMSNNAVKLVKSSFLWEVVSKNTVAFYGEIIKNN